MKANAKSTVSSIDLKLCTVRAVPDAEREFTFEVQVSGGKRYCLSTSVVFPVTACHMVFNLFPLPFQTATRIYTLVAASKEDLDSWMGIVKQNT